MKVDLLNMNENNRSCVIKGTDKRFLLKEKGIDAYGTDRLVDLFIILSSGEKVFVQTICATKIIHKDKLDSTYINNDCYIREVVPFEKAIEYSKQFINILYGN